MSEQKITVKFTGRADKQPCSAVTVSAHGASRKLRHGQAVEAPRAVAEAAAALDGYNFDIKGLPKAGKADSGSQS